MINNSIFPQKKIFFSGAQLQTSENLNDMIMEIRICITAQ